MQRENITIEKRNVLGKQVKALRLQGLLPVNIYGKNMPSISAQVSLKAFKELFKKVHETGLVDIKIEKDTLPTLIHNIQYDPRTHEIIHADFYKVDLKEKIKAHVPVVSVGEAPAVIEKKGILLQILTEVEVEALPTDLPEHIEVSVENLKELDEQITISQIQSPRGVTLLAEPDEIVFKIGELVTQEEEPVAEEAVPAEGAEATAEATATPEAKSE